MAKLTIEVQDDRLCAAIEAEAQRRQQPLTEIIAEALAEWLEGRADDALLLELSGARGEWERVGGLDAVEFFRLLSDERGGPGALPG